MSTTTNAPSATYRAAGRTQTPRRRWRPSFEARVMAPALIVLAALSLFPFVYIILMSLSRVGLIGGIHLHWLGLGNWTRLFSDPVVGASWVRAIEYFVFTVGLEMVIGVAVALMLWEVVRARNVILSLILIPMFMAPVIVGLLGRFLTDSTYGLYAWALKQTGIFTGDIVGSPHTAFISVVLMDVWEWTPLIALIVLAGLTSLPNPVIEAAKLDGATYWQRFRYIVLPMITGVLVIALLIRSMDAIRYYDIITNTTAGGPADATKTIPLRLYEEAFRFFDLGYAAAIGLTMLAFSIVVANLFVRLLRQRGLAQ
ncbi:MAG: sugar ABC transporter permease [Solirubrobacteraceae bacterium]